MSAPDLLTLWKVEDAVEAAWKAVLAADGIAAYTSRETAELPIPRADVVCTLGAVTGHRGEYAPGLFTLDAWQASIRVDVITKRVGSQPAQHADWRAKVRLAAQYFQNRFGPSVLPYHCLTMIQESGTEVSVEDDDESDRSAISFDAIVSIRSDAWPAAEAPEE